MKKTLPDTALEIVNPESTEAITYGQDPANVDIMSTNSTLDGVAVIRWLEQAVPAYERHRGQLARQAVMIGFALIAVRDFGQRGALNALYKMQIFAQCDRTLRRCMKVAQIYADQRGLTIAETGKLKEPQEAASLFQADFDFSDAGAHPLSRDIAAR
jgi:hypothetical protein